MDINENYNSPELDDEEDTGLDFDWIGLGLKLLKCWKFLALMTVAAAVLGVGVALSTKKKYTVKVVLAPEVQGKSSGGALSSITSMLGLGGMSMGSSSDALNITLFPEICHSTLFLTQLFDVEVTPYISSIDLKKGAEAPVPTTLYKYITKADEEPGLMSRIREALFGPAEEIPDTLNISRLTLAQQNVVDFLKTNISASVDKKTAVTSITVTMDDKWIATALADTVCHRLQDYVITYRTKKAKEDLNYYETLASEAKDKMVKAQAAYAQSVDYDRSVILQSVSSAKQRLQQEAQLASDIYSQMAQQVEMAKAKLQEVKPVFAVVQPATMPQRPSSTSRKMIVLAFMLLGFCGAAAWKLFAQDFVASFRGKIAERIDAEEV